MSRIGHHSKALPTILLSLEASSLDTVYLLHFPRCSVNNFDIGLVLMDQSRYQRSTAALHARPQLASKESRSFRENSRASTPVHSPQRPIIGISEMETYNGHVRTPADAILLFEACRLGLLPRVQRRLSEKERQSIKSGSVFVWDEREAGMRRWTDGKSWSASRVSGSFLTYREMEGKRGGNNFGPPLAAVSRAGKTPDSTRGSDSDLDMAAEDGPDGYRYKPDGLMKQSFSITTSSGNHLHLISYYSRAHPTASNLTSPTSDAQLRGIRPQKGMYPESTVHEHQNIPAVTRSPMISAPYSTIPQMAGYARQGPPQWSSHYNGYGWAPPPMQPQAPPQYGYQYAGNAGHYPGGPPPPANGHYAGGPPPPTNGHSPLSQSHSAQPPPSTQSHEPPSMGFDQRRFPPMSGPPNAFPYDARGGPPPTSQQHYGDNYRQPPPEQAPSPYDQRYHMQQYRNPAPAPENLAPPLQQQNRNAHSMNGMQNVQPQQPVYQSQHLTPSLHNPQTAPRMQMQHQMPSNASSTPIDPRLFAPSPITQQQQSNTATDSRTPTPSASMQDSNDTALLPTNGVSQASTIPSIGSIMNGTSTDTNSPNADAKSDKSGDKTPGGSAKKESGPQDIPSDKLGFGEDMRALKVLDRAFKT